MASHGAGTLEQVFLRMCLTADNKAREHSRAVVRSASCPSTTRTAAGGRNDGARRQDVLVLEAYVKSSSSSKLSAEAKTELKRESSSEGDEGVSSMGSGSGSSTPTDSFRSCSAKFPTAGCSNAPSERDLRKTVSLDEMNSLRVSFFYQCLKQINDLGKYFRIW
jgi:hypothetical protein